MTRSDLGDTRRSFQGWRMAWVACLALNCANGLTFGSYGVLVSAFEMQLHASRALASSGLALVTVLACLSAPFLGAALSRLPLRPFMILGALVSFSGYMLLSVLHDMHAILLAYLLVIGPGLVLNGNLITAMLVSRWFVERRGTALGIVNMPILVTLTPFAVATVMSHFGLAIAYRAIACVFLAIIPALLLVIDAPEKIGQRALGEVEGNGGAPGDMPGVAWLLRSGFFLTSCLALTLTVASGPMLYPHLIPMMADRGIDVSRGAILLAVMGGAGIPGALAFGWLADRIGPARGLALCAGLQAGLYALLIVPLGFVALIPVVAVIGMCISGAIGMFAALLAEMFGSWLVGKAMGLANAIDVVFVAGAAPLAGFLYDRTGSYTLTLSLHIAAFTTSATLFLLINRRLAVRKRAG